MKRLTPSEINQIQSYLESNGLDNHEVRDDLVDHICCEMEEKLAEGWEFESVFADTQSIFSPQEILNIQSDTNYFLTIKKTKAMIKGIFITAYISVALYAMSIGFQPFFQFIFQGQEIGFMLIGLLRFAGVSTFIFGFMPLLFLYGYKRFMKQLAS